MTRCRMLSLALLTVLLWGLGGKTSVSAESPKIDPAARQKFVALLTSTRPEIKKTQAPKSKGSLRAFAGPATPTKGARGR